MQILRPQSCVPFVLYDSWNKCFLLKYGSWKLQLESWNMNHESLNQPWNTKKVESWKLISLSNFYMSSVSVIFLFLFIYFFFFYCSLWQLDKYYGGHVRHSRSLFNCQREVEKSLLGATHLVCTFVCLSRG